MARSEKIVIAVFLGVAVALAVWLPLELLARLYQDDAFFYFVIARNFADGLGSTFDGIHATNGYHPLWMLLLSAMHHLVPLAGETGLRAVLLVHAALFGWTLFAASRFLSLAEIPPRLRCGVLVVLAAALGFANVGMEAALWNLWFWLFALGVLRLCTGVARPADPVLLAVSVVGCYLTRSDSILFLVPMAAVANWELARRDGWPRALVRGAAMIWAPLGTAAVGQVAVNLLYFGHIKTISSELKTGAISLSFDLLKTSDGRSFQTLFHRGVFLAMLGAAVVALLLLYRARWASEAQQHVRRLLLAANGYIVLFLAAALLTLREPPRTWYYTVALSVLVATLAALAVGWSRGRAARTTALWTHAGIALLAVALGGALLVQYQVTKRRNSLAVAGWLRRNTRPEQVAFLIDGCGIVRYFSERPVIDGDGLVNTFEFKRVVEERRLAQYLKDEHVDIVIANAGDDSPEELKLYSAMWPGNWPYVYATASRRKALAEFTKEGHFGYMPFAIADLRFVENPPPNNWDERH